MERKAIWTPQSDRQWLALLTRADELYYGGAAGGGKTDLVIGMAVELHQHSAIFRRVYPNLKEIMRRTRELLAGIDGWDENKSDRAWTNRNGNTIEFGAIQFEDNKTNWQGRPHDLKAFDEIPEFTLSQYLFASGWNRTVDPNQRTRVLVTGNPPIDEAGSWVIDRWGAWLREDHPNPAEAGELRYYAVVGDEEVEFPDGKSRNIKGEVIYPRSRTFIPALLEDNPYYSQDNRYRSVLQSLPEPLRSMLLYGDFKATAVVDPFQVIPTEWVKAAQRRWLETPKPNVPMTSCGVDPARGGKDKFSIAPKYDNYFDEITSYPGAVVKDGIIGRDKIREVVRDEQPLMNIDVIGIGSSVFDFTKLVYNMVRPINVAENSTYRDKSGKLKMKNKRAEMYWRMRDTLNPANNENACLPPGNNIIADLCSARYKVTASGVVIEEKDDIKARIGRSPDEGEALLLANMVGGVVPEDQPGQVSKWVDEESKVIGKWRY